MVVGMTDFAVADGVVYLSGRAYPAGEESGMSLLCSETGQSVEIDLFRMPGLDEAAIFQLEEAFLAACSAASGVECKCCMIAGFTGRLKEFFDWVGLKEKPPLVFERVEEAGKVVKAVSIRWLPEIVQLLREHDVQTAIAVYSFSAQSHFDLDEAMDRLLGRYESAEHFSTELNKLRETQRFVKFFKEAMGQEEAELDLTHVHPWMHRIDAEELIERVMRGRESGEKSYGIASIRFEDGAFFFLN